jgi:hypothetical protein
MSLKLIFLISKRKYNSVRKYRIVERVSKWNIKTISQEMVSLYLPLRDGD